MSVDPSDLSDQARNARRANNDMFDSLGELGDSIDREEGLIDDLERGLEEPRGVLYDVLEQMETDYRRVEAFADEMQSRQEGQNNRLEDIIEDYQQDDTQNQYSWSTGGPWQRQLGWGMYQQGPIWQQQGFGWNSNFWSAPYQSQGQSGYGPQQSQAQSWQSEFFGESDEDILEDDGSDEQVSTPEDVTDEEDEYTEPESSESRGESGESYDEADRSFDMGDNRNPDASFDYEAEQSTETVNQSFSFSGSGFEPSGSITMEQSAGGETQYFEASF